MATTDSEVSVKVVGMDRNRWSACSGVAGRHELYPVVGMNRTGWSTWLVFGGRFGSYSAQRAQAILEATEPVRRLPKTPALLLRAELIRQLCEELLTSHERTLRLKRLLENDLLPRTGQHLQTLRGVDTVLATTVLGETGDIHRFRSRHAFAKYNGTAPAPHSSGGKERHTARKSCNHRLKRAMWLMAFAAVRHDPLAQAYYQRCRQRGLRPIEAIKRVARRMSDIVYAMLAGTQTLRSRPGPGVHRSPPTKASAGNGWHVPQWEGLS
ncbi:MAG: IS110 family transposase [Limnochordaceae bacterium]|nr:IS110 family transposase [Limnochordaceae bacterium]